MIEFEDASGVPLEISEFKSIMVDGKSVPRNRELAAGQILAKGLTSSNKVLVYEIKEGKHDVRITAIVDGSTFVAQGMIDVKKKDKIFKLKLTETK